MSWRLRLLVLAALIVPPSSAAAGPILLDQFLVPPQPIALGAAINHCCPFVAQTYTAGLTGRLAGVSLNIETSHWPGEPTLQVSIKDVSSAGAPGATTFATVRLETGYAALDQLIRLPGGVPQVAGTQYAIVVSYPDAGSIYGPGTWGGTLDNRYPAGEMWFQWREWGPNRWGYGAPDRSADLFFMTYVEPVPEPGSLLLLASGLVLLRRRRH